MVFSPPERKLAKRTSVKWATIKLEARKLTTVEIVEKFETRFNSIHSSSRNRSYLIVLGTFQIYRFKMVPVIDMQEITQFPQEETLQEETLHDFGSRLLSALSSFGMVQLVSHGIPIVSCWLFLNYSPFLTKFWLNLVCLWLSTFLVGKRMAQYNSCGTPWEFRSEFHLKKQIKLLLCLPQILFTFLGFV